MGLLGGAPLSGPWVGSGLGQEASALQDLLFPSQASVQLLGERVLC